MNENVLWGLFPLFFVGMWLVATSVLAFFAGWPTLQQLFPDRDEQPIDRLRMQSGSLGKGSLWNPWGNVRYGGCLRFDVCRSGLRVAVWKIFGPFVGPFFVPWPEITVTEWRFLFFRMYRLSLGRSGSFLTIRARAYRRIAAKSPIGTG